MAEQRKYSGGETGASSKSLAGNNSIIPQIAASLIDYEPSFEPTLVLVVTQPDGNQRRRVLLSAHAADKAIKRARARGQRATVHLAELRPIKALYCLDAEAGAL